MPCHIRHGPCPPVSHEPPRRPADPCTGAHGRDFLLGIRRGQPVGAHVPSWCSRHEVDGWSLPTSGPAWRAYDLSLPDAADGTGGRPLLNGIECLAWSSLETPH